jgi:subtilisin family serine protease
VSRRVLTLISTLTLLFSVSGPAYASAQPANADALESAVVSRVSPKLQLEAATAEPAVINPLKGATEGIFVIRLDAEPLATYRGGVVGLAPTSPEVTGAPRLDTATVESRAYADYLETAQSTFVARLEKAIGHTADVRFTYKNSTNGLAVWLTPREAALVARMPGVESVRQEVIEQLQTDVGPTWIGAPSLWGGATSCEEGGYCGEGVIVGVLDSGINPSNPSFAATGGDGYTHTNPYGSGTYVGVCDSDNTDIYDSTFSCNDKLIGAWDYTATDAYDDDGHGSHTASTAAGNFVEASLVAPTLTVARDISGVAPHANIISYRVCLDGAGCPSAGTIAAIDQAIADGVDVINFSVGSPSPENPYTSDSQLAWLSAREAGIAVAHSAGNEGPDPATVGSPQAPWMMHVAASTHNRKYVNTLESMTGGDTTPPADIEGAGFTSGVGPLPIVYAGDFPSDLTDTPELCGVGDIDDFVSPWPEGTFTGHIVVCDRGTFGRVEKGANVLAAGAAGYVLADNGSGIVGDAHELPGVHIVQADGEVLKAWLASGTGHTATIGGAVLDDSAANGDVLAGFSSRGPNRSVPNMISPSVAAPGVDIIAANGAADEISWGFNSGTSMASPHGAGALALLVDAHPDWTPAELQSALMTTAYTGVVTEDGVTPANWFDMGSGRIQVDQATDAGLVLDIDNAAFAASDPATGGDPATLNLPSMANSQCVVECSWTRTVTATTAGTWTAAATADEIDLSVTPASFTLAEGETQELTITAGVEGLTNDVWIYGQVTLSATGVPDTLLPVAVAPSTGSLPPSVEIETRRDAGSQLVTDLTAIEITQLHIETFGMTIGTQLELELAEDSSNGSIFDDLSDGVFWTTVDSPAGAQRLVAETFDSEAPDLDLFVGTGATPSDASTVCVSASASADEFCDITNPAAGTYWIAVQSWSGSGADTDMLKLSYAVVDGDQGNFLIEGPAQQPQLDPFDIRILFNEPALAAGDRAYGAFSIGTSPAKPGNVGTVPVNLVRLGDDVSKTVSCCDGRAGRHAHLHNHRRAQPQRTPISPMTVDRPASRRASPTCRDRPRADLTPP